MKKVAFYLFTFALIFSPMAFGTVETWAYLVLESIICICALLLFNTSGQTFYRVPGILPLFVINAFVLFQLIPLPPGFIKLLSPATYAIYQSVNSLADKTQWISLSIYPKATLLELLRFSAYGLFYFIAVQLFSDRSLLKKTLTVIAVFAALLSVEAIIEITFRHFHSPLFQGKLLGFRELRHGGIPVGPYVNRNHYAGLMEMIFPLVLSMFLAYRPQITKVSLKKRIADFFSHKRVNLHFLYGTAAILIATSILLSLSRGGILSLSLSLIIFSAMLIVKAKQKKAGLLIGFIVIIVIFLTGTSGWDAIFNRFENLSNKSGMINSTRLIYWKDSINIFRDFPLTGTGTGTFEKIYPLYRSAPGNKILEHAHNDYLEFLVTGGIILPALMAWCLFAILYPAFRSFIRRREPYSMLLFFGCLISVSAILIHSLVDFNMQVGANGLYFFLVLALAVSAANTRMRYGLNATYLKPSAIPAVYPWLFASFLLISVIYMQGGALVADRYFSDYRNVSISPDSPEKKISGVNQAAKKAALFDRLNPKFTHILANTSSLLSKNSDALKYYARALRLGPANSQYLMDAAFFMYQQGRQELSESLFKNSIQYDPKNMAAYVKYAATLFETNQTGKSFKILKQAISVDPGITDTCLALMVLYHIDENRMRLALPDRVEPYLVLGDFFVSMGESSKAESSYLTALENLANETRIEKNYFLHIYRFYQKNGSNEKALQIILKAITYFPNDSHLHRTAGDLYKKLEIDYRADEEYRKAKILRLR